MVRVPGVTLQQNNMSNNKVPIDDMKHVVVLDSGSSDNYFGNRDLAKNVRQTEEDVTPESNP